MHSLADGPAGLIVFASAVVLAVLSREIVTTHPTGARIRAAFLWASASIAAVAVIYWAFAYSLDVGIAVRPWAKAVSGATAGVSAWHGYQATRAAWKRR